MSVKQGELGSFPGVPFPAHVISSLFFMKPKNESIKNPRLQRRYGIGEWYGKSFIALNRDERGRFAEIQKRPKAERFSEICPFQSIGNLRVYCNKAGGVCSLRLYERAGSERDVVASGYLGNLVTTCPNRFEEDQLIYHWVGETLLNCTNPIILKEIGFLEPPAGELSAEKGKPSKDVVGRIDRVLVSPGVSPLSWCALEVQAVYFQGPGMKSEFDAMFANPVDTLPFPERVRRPDYRSSGPKRLMPQLQIKVPSLRRWGKKMAVVIDESFFGAMGKMDVVAHVSNCDVAWFVVGYEEIGGIVKIVPRRIQLTTLEHSVEGLTAGVPVSLEAFEKRIIAKLRSVHLS